MSKTCQDPTYRLGNRSGKTLAQYATAPLVFGRSGAGLEVGLMQVLPRRLASRHDE